MFVARAAGAVHRQGSGFIQPHTPGADQFQQRQERCHIGAAAFLRAEQLAHAAQRTFQHTAQHVGHTACHRYERRGDCGTGHGVGYISSVHEGPQSLRPQNPIVFKEGMTITDEPGVYETDEVGIRIENELECVDAGTNQYGHWLKFEPLTLVPISTEPVIVDELTRDQINWLNAYHAHVYEMLSPRLTEEEKTWLKAKTAPIDR